MIDSDVAAFLPPEPAEPFPQYLETLGFRGVLGSRQQYANTPHPVGLLRPRHHRPRRRAAKPRDKGAASTHSITSSARAKMDGGTSIPIALAALRLTTNWNFVGCSTGKSAGFAPLKI